MLADKAKQEMVYFHSKPEEPLALRAYWVPHAVDVIFCFVLILWYLFSFIRDTVCRTSPEFVSERACISVVFFRLCSCLLLLFVLFYLFIYFVFFFISLPFLLSVLLPLPDPSPFVSPCLFVLGASRWPNWSSPYLIFLDSVRKTI